MVFNMELNKLIDLLEKNCSSANCEYMGVMVDTVQSTEDLFENIEDEIVSIEINIDGGYEEDLWGMTVREAHGYVTRLKNFLKKYDN